MALVALAPAVRNASTRSASAAPSRGAFIRWVAGHVPLRAEPLLPVRAVAHPDLGVLVHPDATADELTSALLLYVRAQGLDAVDARALILPTARRRLRTVRAKISRTDATEQAGDPRGPGPGSVVTMRASATPRGARNAMTRR